ncbi:glycosyltransferase family 4 protein [Sphingomonas koreensis]
MAAYPMSEGRRYDTPPATNPGLRVALFSGNYDCVRDGANQALNRLVDHLLREEGATVRVYSPVAAEPAFNSVGDVVPVRSIAIPGRGEYRVALGLPSKVKRDIRAFAPDIVHLSAPDWLGWRAQRFARELGVPVVSSLHTRFETYLDYYGLRRLRGLAERYLARFYRGCDHVLAPTEAIARAFRQTGMNGQVTVWGRGVDHGQFNPGRRSTVWRSEMGYAHDEVVPLFFGRLVREKGIGLFIEVIRTMRERGYRLRPLIVGDGPAGDWFAEQLPNANFLGHLSGNRLGTAIASADVLINPSVTEAFGNVNLEAMASGVSIISARVESAAALIEHGVSGLLVQADDATAYADALEQLILSRTARMALGTVASQHALAHDWHRQLSSVAAVYAACLGRKLRAGTSSGTCAQLPFTGVNAV